MPLYAPLHGEQAIRLLELHPSKGQLITCSLIYTDLKDIQRNYDAVSYTWGDASVEHEILLDGIAVQTRSSVFEILNRFREVEKPRLLWIDSLCINQEDLEERSQQVTIMQDIYKLAHTVLVWLGRATDGTIRAMEYISTVRPDASVMEADMYSHYGNEDLWFNKSTIFDDLESNQDNKRLVEALVELLGRPWFTRIWIQQEAAANRETHIFCGQNVVPWEQLFAISWLMRPRSPSWPDWVLGLYPNIQPMLLAMTILQSSRRSTLFPASNSVTWSIQFRNLLEHTWPCAATDARDKIFALRGLLSQYQCELVPYPDYTTCWEDLYTDVAIRLLKSQETYEQTDLLRCAGRANQQTECHLPSWVPDWRTWPGNEWGPPSIWKAGSHRLLSLKFGSMSKRDQYTLRPKWSSVGSLSKLKLAARATLILPCIMQDSIAFLSGVEDGLFYSEGLLRVQTDKNFSRPLLQLDKSCQDYLQKHHPQIYLTGEPTSIAYRATLITNRTANNKIATPDYYEKYDEWHLWLNEGANISDEPTYHAAIQESITFHQRQLCVTKHGYICLVPAVTRIEDSIAILTSLNMPVVLRPRQLYYELIGCCYVHGMMENQAYCLMDYFNIKHRGSQSNSLDIVSVRHGRVDDQSGGKIQGIIGSNEDYRNIIPTLGTVSIELI